jgi:hypothetical protein
VLFRGYFVFLVLKDDHFDDAEVRVRTIDRGSLFPHFLILAKLVL